MRAAGLREPEFSLKGPKGVVEKVVDKDVERSATLKTTQKIVDAIRQNPAVTRDELATSAGITLEGIKYHLRRMQKSGIIRGVGPDKGGHWEISENLAPKTA